MDIDHDTGHGPGSDAFRCRQHMVIRTPLRRTLSALLLGAIVVGLPACGAGAPATGAPNGTRTSPTSTAATLPPTTTAPAAQTAAAASLYVTLPQSRTPEGYFVLGEPDAPILIQHYSDFL